jgi:hypothetical protein
MTLEEQLKSALDSLVDGRVYADIVPPGAEFPCITYQGVGGGAGWYADQSVPGKEHNRVQINTHTRGRLEANQLARLIAATFNESQPYGRFVATYDDVLQLRGTRQDFGIQFAVSL